MFGRQKIFLLTQTSNLMGIDPGMNGGICLMVNHKIDTLDVMPLIGKELDLKELKRLITYRYLADPDHIYIEHVHAIYGSAAKATFKFGQVFGMTEAIVSSLDIPYTLVQPKKWQLVCHGGIDRKTKAKDRSLIAASKRFPKVDFRKNERCRIPHDGLIDAALIAEYGSQIYEN